MQSNLALRRAEASAALPGYRRHTLGDGIGQPEQPSDAQTLNDGRRLRTCPFAGVDVGAFVKRVRP